MLLFLKSGNLHSFDLRLSEYDCFQIISLTEFELFQHLAIQGLNSRAKYLTADCGLESCLEAIINCVIASYTYTSMYKVNVLASKYNTHLLLCSC